MTDNVVWFIACKNVTATASVTFTRFAIVLLTIPMSFLTSTCNIAILCVIFKLPRLHTASNILLAILSIADFPIGLIVQPIFVMFCIQDLRGVCISTLRIFHACFSYFFCSCSALTIAIISIDRCIQVSFPLKSRAWDLKTKYIYLICLTWLTMAIIIILFFLEILSQSSFQIISIFFIAFILAASVISYKVIYYNIQKSTRSVIDLGMHETARQQRLLFQKKSAKMIKVICSVLFACYLPRLLTAFLKRVKAVDHSTLYFYDRWSAFFVFLNATLNPVIYVARVEEVRNEVVEMWSKLRSRINGFRNRVSIAQATAATPVVNAC